MSALAFIKVNRLSINELTNLQVKPSQQHLISDNKDWLEEVLARDESLSFGIYHNQAAAGLITLLDPRTTNEDKDHFQPDCLYVWRLMIDQHHQGKQLGESAIAFCQQFATLMGLQGVTLTTMDTEKGNALSFYLSLGFEPTGRRLDGEIELMWRAKR